MRDGVFFMPSFEVSNSQQRFFQTPSENNIPFKKNNASDKNF
jgi:hypothetical protein